MRLFSVISKTHIRRGGGLTHLERCSRSILQPQMTRQGYSSENFLFIRLLVRILKKKKNSFIADFIHYVFFSFKYKLSSSCRYYLMGSLKLRFPIFFNLHTKNMDILKQNTFLCIFMQYYFWL